jgi:hypothetical protein
MGMVVGFISTGAISVHLYIPLFFIDIQIWFRFMLFNATFNNIQLYRGS